MKKIYSFILFLSLVNTAFSQMAIEWQKNYGGSGSDRFAKADITNDGGYIVAGSSNSTDGDVSINYGFHDIWVVKLNPFGIIEWEKTYGGSSGEVSEHIEQTNDNGYIIVGNTTSNDGDVSLNQGWNDYWIIKIDSIGNIEWQKTYGGTFIDAAHSIRQTFDGGYIVAGETASNDGDVTGHHGSGDFWILKLDNNGNLIWQKCLGGSGDDRAFYIQQTNDSGYVVTGYTASSDGDVTGNHGNYDIWVVKLDITGNIQWQKCLGGSEDDHSYHIQQTVDLGYVVCGWTRSDDGDISNPLGNMDFWIVKLNQTGNIEWEYCYGGTADDAAFIVQQISNGNYILTGATNSNNGNVTNYHGGMDIWILELDSNGLFLWEKTLGGSDMDDANTIHQISNDNYLIAGETRSNDGDITAGYGNFDWWVIKLANILTVPQINDPFNLSFYPNPTTSELNISFTLEKASHVNMQLYNSLEQLVKTIINKKLIAGENKINFSTGNIPVGIYHLIFSVDGELIARKVVKM